MGALQCRLHGRAGACELAEVAAVGAREGDVELGSRVLVNVARNMWNRWCPARWEVERLRLNKSQQRARQEVMAYRSQQCSSSKRDGKSNSEGGK